MYIALFLIPQHLIIRFLRHIQSLLSSHVLTSIVIKFDFIRLVISRSSTSTTKCSLTDITINYALIALISFKGFTCEHLCMTYHD